MSNKLEHGKGDILAVSTTPVIEYLSPNATNGGGNKEFADEIEIWNTGLEDVRIQFNIEATDFTVANGGVIPAEEKSVRFNLRNPITKFVYATESGTSTIKYFAS